MEWHFRANGTLKHYQPLSTIREYIPRNQLFSKLGQRYNFSPKCAPVTHNVTLPSSKATANVVTYDAATLMISLLTDPRIRDSDYLFWGNNPFSPPPDSFQFIEDINTGKAYTETYKKLITNPDKQVLLPVIFYIDAANT